jgi:hypothetical protein
MRNTDGHGGAERDEMRGNEPTIDAGTAERILGGQPAGPPALARLFAAATRPDDPQPDDRRRFESPDGSGPTPGEERAVAAFRAARLAAPATRSLATLSPSTLSPATMSPATMSPSTMSPATVSPATVSPTHARPDRPAWGRALAVKFAALALALVAGGVAVAASVGVIPGSSTPPPANSASASIVDATTTTPAAAVSPSPRPSLPADIDGLCRAFQNEAIVDSAAAAHNPRFAELIAAAGGVEKLASFCESVLATAAPHGSGPPSAQPGHSNDASPPHATGKPSAPGHAAVTQGSH